MVKTSFKNSVVPVLRQVREIVLPFYGNAAVLRHKDSSAHNVVTELDVKVEEFIAAKLRKLYPSVEFAGEETGGNRGAERFWLLDPIDGTAHFIRGLPFCTTMLALIDGGEVVFGAIYDFVNDNMYIAERDKGATLNGTSIHVSNRSLREAYIGWETHLDKEENQKIFNELRKKCVLFHSVSSGFEHAMTASGKLDGRICFDPHGKDYDFAPGALLVREAGGKVANLGKDYYDHRNVNFIAANSKIYTELTQGPGALFPVIQT